MFYNARNIVTKKTICLAKQMKFKTRIKSYQHVIFIEVQTNFSRILCEY